MGSLFCLPDENKKRGNWSSPVEFLLSGLGSAVGFRNLWRFPYLCSRYGGALFLIPYLVMLVAMGIPMLFLEMSLGQFAGQGVLTCWNFAPFFQGVGLGMVLLSAMLVIYYNVIVGWSYYYLFASFTSNLPWASCDPEWSTKGCNVQYFEDQTDCTALALRYDNTSGACYDGDGTVIGYVRRMAYDNGIFPTSPAEEYFNNYVLGSNDSSGVDDLGPIRWKIALCSLFAFCIVFLVLSCSIKSLGKVVYFTALFPYVALVILLIRGLMLDGHKEGIDYYIQPPGKDRAKEILNDYDVWKDAAIQVFHSLNIGWGGWITLSSYNRFHNNCLRDAILIGLANFLTSFFAGFVVYAYVGAFAFEQDVPVYEVFTFGLHLAFVVFPMALQSLPGATFWSILFFLMLVTLGIDTQFVLVETISTALMDMFKQLRAFKPLLVLAVCIPLFLLGLPITTSGGINVMTLMDVYVGSWALIYLAFLECVSIGGYLYGIMRYMKDIEIMLGTTMFFCVPFFVIKIIALVFWCIITPTALWFFMVIIWKEWDDWNPLSPSDIFPKWTYTIGWLIVMVPIAAFVGGTICALLRGKGSLSERIGQVFRPTKYWGPALAEHRALMVKHRPGFVVDPSGDQLHHVHHQHPTATEFTELGMQMEPLCVPIQEKGVSANTQL